MGKSKQGSKSTRKPSIWEWWPTEKAIEARYERAVWHEEIISFLMRLFALIAVLVILFLMVFGIFTEDDMEMSPAVRAGDLAIYQRGIKEFRLEDVLIYEADGKERIGRVVARPTDTVEITSEGAVKVNGYVQIEERITNGTSIEPGVSYPLTLKADEYFILADARGDAKDSRLFGPVSRDHILGRVAFLLRMDDF